MTKLIFIVSHLIACACFAQKTDVILFSEQGEKFYLSINGAQVNASPASRVEAPDITGDFAQLNVRFEEAGAPALTKQMMLEPGKQLTAILKRGKRGKYVFRPVSTAVKPESEEQTVSVPVAVHTAHSEPEDDVHVEYASQRKSGNLVDLEVRESGGVSLSVNLPADDLHTSDYDRQTDHGNRTTPHFQSNNLTARVEGKKIILSDGRTLDWKYTKTKKLTGVEIEMKEPLDAQVAVSYDGKVTYETEVPFFYREPDWKKSNEYFKLTVKETNGATWSVKLQHSSNNRILINNLVGVGSAPTITTVSEPAADNYANDCSGMATGDFQRAVSSIKNKSFADEKMAVTKQILRANCLYVSQVKTVMDLFTYEEDKIAVAKKAYVRTVDQNNYYQLNDALTYSESVEELNQFLENQY